jgi:very-short-patch-repair endonuclease
VDGPIHDYNKEYDQDRDSKLISKGINIVRIKNDELDDLDQVISKIDTIIRELMVK